MLDGKLSVELSALDLVRYFFCVFVSGVVIFPSMYSGYVSVACCAPICGVVFNNAAYVSKLPISSRVRFSLLFFRVMRFTKPFLTSSAISTWTVLFCLK